MSDPLKPIGNTAASLTAPAQTPVSRGSVISTLANTILANYGKALLLVGAVCLIGYWVTYRQGSGSQNQKPPSDPSKDDLRSKPENLEPSPDLSKDDLRSKPENLEPPSDPSKDDLSSKPQTLEPSPDLSKDDLRSKPENLEPSPDLSKDDLSSGPQTLEPSPDLSPNDLDEAREVIREMYRHEAVLALLEEKNPGFVEQVIENLTSSNMDDVRGCRSLLQDRDIHNPIAAFKLGENPWILPKINNEEIRTQLKIFQKDGSEKSYYIRSNIQTNRTILTQLGFTDEEFIQSSAKHWLTFIILENQVKGLKILDEEEKPLPKPVAIEFFKVPNRLPTICKEYTEEQTQFAQILMNTLWLNSLCEKYKANLYDVYVTALFEANEFTSILGELEKLCLNVCPPFTLAFGENSFKTDAEASIDSFEKLLTDEFVESLDNPIYAQFRMDKVIPFLYRKSIIITGPDGAGICPAQHTHWRLFDSLRTALNVKHNDLPKEETIQEIYIGTNEVKFTWIENSESKSSTYPIVDRSIPFIWKNDEAKEAE
ncbi:MAG: hypothetical protein ABSA17_00875 [Rhabdochlamydiaceae bacterium]|jgi:hypothetical protein